MPLHGVGKVDKRHHLVYLGRCLHQLQLFLLVGEYLGVENHVLYPHNPFLCVDLLLDGCDPLFFRLGTSVGP
ncbi:MAG: hypothetical protein A4E65_00091 [Syntrophorhabdus sp. PtaU1.Bin153]|nr:MAG: hypothetical protein A4E65_00091 [Syntrophorhabdus sp. PtaU1.Bin153]